MDAEYKAYLEGKEEIYQDYFDFLNEFEFTGKIRDKFFEIQDKFIEIQEQYMMDNQTKYQEYKQR